MDEPPRNNKTIIYGSPTFFGDLSRDMAEGPVSVETGYTKLHDVPKDLRDKFRLDEAASPDWVDPKTGKFVPGASVPTEANLRSIIAGGAAALGAGGGFLAAGPLGAAVGAIVGVGVGVVVGTVRQKNIKTRIEIDAKGKLTLNIEPK